MNTNLRKIKKTHLSHSFDGVVAHVLIIFVFDNGCNLLKGILRIHVKEDEWFLLDGILANHQALTLPRIGLGGQLEGVGSFTSS